MSQPADAETSETMEQGGTVDTRSMRMLSGVAILLGAWLVASPLVFEATDMALWNNIIVGLAIVILAGFNYFRMTSERMGNVGVSTLVALLGIWALLVPFVIDMGSEGLLWGTAIAGLIIAILSGYNAYSNRKAARARAGTRA